MTDMGAAANQSGEIESLVQSIEDCLAACGIEHAQRRRWTAEKVLDALGLEQVGWASRLSALADGDATPWVLSTRHPGPKPGYLAEHVAWDVQPAYRLGDS